MDWEWYTDVNTKTLFLHCLLKANWKETEWRGIHLRPGEFVTSWPKIAKETGLSIQQARTAFSRLESTGEVTARSTDFVTGEKITKGRVITINNWDSYQGDNRDSNRLSNRDCNSESTGHQQTLQQDINSRYKNIKNIKEDKNPPNPPRGDPNSFQKSEDQGEPWPDNFWE